ncbi:MAG: hypothetical protein D6759_18360 [Chloroflexi bacterium]|nr:MAG: hypothetical protein D6759_18360 [Chloroflexota bacterium]
MPWTGSRRWPAPAGRPARPTTPSPSPSASPPPAPSPARTMGPAWATGAGRRSSTASTCLWCCATVEREVRRTSKVRRTF